ncbi:MAG: AAA family ATPase, partial [Ruminococcus flavefaciens]|nr:AAA family ATPase [Ruminococcus flavefaciens]
WDCIFRMKQNDSNSQKEYLNFLRALLKDHSYVALAYMTGILPIKKYGEHSALNMFDEFSMTNQGSLAEFTGFTEDEVKSLCEQYDMPFATTKKWYDGYNLNDISIYNPRSVVKAMTERTYDDYWTKTETYEVIRTYIEMNYNGLRDTLIDLIAGERKQIDTTTLSRDTSAIYKYCSCIGVE